MPETIELTSYFNNEQFVFKTKQQIIKDFDRHGIHLREKIEESTLPLSDLFLIMEEVLEQIYRKYPSKWSALIYTIDIPEKEYRMLMQESDWKKTATAVIRREALKVYIREFYSS